MNFGSALPPVQFRNDTSLELEPTCRNMMEAIREGRREWGKPLKVRLLQPLISIIPELIEGMIMKHMRRTHFRPKVSSA